MFYHPTSKSYNEVEMIAKCDEDPKYLCPKDPKLVFPFMLYRYVSYNSDTFNDMFATANRDI